MKLSAVHCGRPYQPHVDLPFCEEPECFFCSFRTWLVAVEHEVHAVDAELFGEADDFLALCLGHAIGHDGKGGDAEGVEVDDVVETFDEDQPVLLDEFAVAGFFQTAGLLAEELLTAMETFRETVLHRSGTGRAFSRRKASEIAFFLFVVGITSDPGEDFAVFGEDRVNDLASQAEAAFVATAVCGQNADSPLCHRFRCEARMASDVTRRCRSPLHDKPFIADDS